MGEHWRKWALVLVFLHLTVNSVTNAEVYTQPEQVHLAYGDDCTQMVVTWVTQSNTSVSIVEYGQKALTSVAKGTQDVFQDGGSEARKIYMHRVVLTGLQPGQKYLYHCGSPLGWSSLFYFTAMKEGSNWGPRFAVYGDFGNANAQSMGRLQEEVAKQHFDAILHVGDFAYNMDTDNARVGDAFMNQVQSIAAYLPYMTCVGNHEQAYNFSNYASRFTMPKAKGDGHNMYYSFNVGPAHIVAFSSEYYYYVEYGWAQIVNQYKWLENDLKEANRPENRAKRPWIITMCHRPLYCSNSDDPEHCTNNDNVIRIGIPIVRAYGIEDLLYKYGVDLHFQAHEHAYERMWPVYNMTCPTVLDRGSKPLLMTFDEYKHESPYKCSMTQVCNGTQSPYKNPRAPVHVVSGSAGCQEGEDPFLKVPNPWSAFHSDDYGYTRMNIINSTHLYMEQVSDDKGGVVIDNMMLIKEKHGAGLYDCHEQ